MIKDKFDFEESFSCPFTEKIKMQILIYINIMIKDKFDFKESLSCPFTEKN